MSSKTGSRARIESKRVRQSGGSLITRPKTAMGGNVPANAILSQSLAAQKKNSMGAYGGSALAAVANSAINVRISKVSDAVSERPLSDKVRGVKIPHQKDGNRRRVLNTTQKTFKSGTSQESVQLPSVTAMNFRASAEHSMVMHKKQDSPKQSQSGQSSFWSKLNMRPVSTQSKRVMVANSDLINNLSMLGNLDKRISGGNVLRDSHGHTLKEQLEVLDRKFKFT